MSKKADSADLIKRAGRNWLAAQAAGKGPSEWVHDLQLEWLSSGQIERMCEFILFLCENVEPDSELIGLIGADPMLALMLWSPDQALPAIEEMADKHPIVIDALYSIARAERPERPRIEALLARHGRSLG